MEPALEQILRSPRLEMYARSIQQRLEAERVAREKFYDELNEDVKAEFINGEVIVHSPVKWEHDGASKLPFKLLDTYVSMHQLGYVGHEKMLVALTRNDYEPDICFWSSAKSSTFSSKQMKFPAPDLIVEVLSPSTESTDRGVKFEDYAAHGVGEYWIIDPDTRFIEQYVLDGQDYRLRIKANSGRIVSPAVPGFDVPVEALFDEKANLAALRAILSAG